jgi:hypothetical protein
VKLKFALIALLVSSMTAVGLIVAKVHHVQGQEGFTLRITQTAYPADRAPIVSATKVRYQKADGSWKMETTYSNGRIDVGFSQPGRGVFHVNQENQRLDYLSENSGDYRSYSTNEDRLRSDPKFVGTETILGFKTFHIHSDSPEAGQYVDSYICPALQGYPLRVISGDTKGNKTVFDTTQVILGEPSFTVPNYPVDTSQYKEIHGAGTQ